MKTFVLGFFRLLKFLRVVHDHYNCEDFEIGTSAVGFIVTEIRS